MASSIPNQEEELRKALETLINCSAFTEKAKMDPEKYPHLEQHMQTCVSISMEIMHKAKDCQINCREYLLNCQASLLRPTPGRGK
ncbi:hypothetical protein ACJMK2_033986 [Sinanodonta woodiana]|uniref:Uncharacterized protein n=1 Tax=Sinanodonta woodiana TaxID=1069815 RepID=A0ABD3WSB6_SINWO